MGIESDLTDEALQIYLDDAEAEIGRAAGASGTVTADFRMADADGKQLFLSPAAGSITSVTEVTPSGSTALVEGTDYIQQYGGRVLYRLNTWRWLAGHCCGYQDAYVRVVYTASTTDAARMKRVQCDLVKLALTYRGSLKSVSDGDHSASSLAGPDSYEAERRSILSALTSSGGVFV